MKSSELSPADGRTSQRNAAGAHVRGNRSLRTCLAAAGFTNGGERVKMNVFDLRELKSARRWTCWAIPARIGILPTNWKYILPEPPHKNPAS